MIGLTELTAWIGVVAGLITILGGVVGLTRYITMLQAKIVQERLEVAKAALETQNADLKARYEHLVDQVAASGQAGSLTLQKKIQIDGQLKSLMSAFMATAGSIYVPLRSRGGEAHSLAFLSIQPFGRSSEALRHKIVPLKSLAGKCFTSGRSFAVTNAASDPDHFKAADRFSSYTTAQTLNVVLRTDNDVVGVLQLLNREGGEGFREADIERAEGMLGALPAEVADLTRDPIALETLGIVAQASAETATVMFSDLSNSAVLFQELSAELAIQMLNEYFETICEIAFRHGATIDNYMGDGVLIRFNVPKSIKNHPLTAIECALEMNAAFGQLKDYWLAVTPRLTGLFNRCGIETGPVNRATLGHPQFQHLTILGYPISVAAALCANAARDHDVVVIGEGAFEATLNKVTARPLPDAALGKASTFIGRAYEVLSPSAARREPVRSLSG